MTVKHIKISSKHDGAYDIWIRGIICNTGTATMNFAVNPGIGITMSGIVISTGTNTITISDYALRHQ